MYRDILNFSIAPHMQRVLTAHGFYASIMRSEKKKESSGAGLPPGIPIPVLPLDYLKVKPDSWIGGEGSYVCPTASEWGLWFNFSMNNLDETAVILSIKGMNPLTGQRVCGYDLEKYNSECPIHHKMFSKNRLCPECGFQWPAQNYIAKENPYIDGFRTPDGHVRQFYFTEDVSKSIPENVIGKEDTVPAFGFCFYSTKNKKAYCDPGERLKNKFPEGYYSNRDMYFASSAVYRSAPLHKTYDTKACGLSKSLRTSPISDGSFCLGGLISPPFNPEIETKSSYDCSKGAPDTLRGMKSLLSGSDGDKPAEHAYFSDCNYELEAVPSMDFSAPEVKRAEVGVGAGEKICQDFKQDKRAITAWGEKPASIMRIYFVFQEEFETYVSYGLKDLKGSSEGYLEGLKVGGGNE